MGNLPRQLLVRIIFNEESSIIISLTLFGKRPVKDVSIRNGAAWCIFREERCAINKIGIQFMQNNHQGVWCVVTNHIGNC